MNIDRSERLPEGQYGRAADAKSLLVLHHTVGGSAKSSIQWWRDDPRLVGVAYVIERDGTVYECFPPECWAWHIGVKDERQERRSIGIELASEGGLVEREGKLVAFDGQRVLGEADALLKAGRVVRLKTPYRGYTWFDAYEDAQVAAALALVDSLCTAFGIPRTLPLSAPTPDGDPRPWLTYSGVLHHAMLRKDKSDLNPSFPYAALAKALGDTTWPSSKAGKSKSVSTSAPPPSP